MRTAGLDANLLFSALLHLVLLGNRDEWEGGGQGMKVGEWGRAASSTAQHAPAHRSGRTSRQDGTTWLLNVCA